MDTCIMLVSESFLEKTLAGPKKGTPVSKAAEKHQFKGSGNPGGMTKAQHALWRGNALKASQIREELLEATESRIATVKNKVKKGDMEPEEGQVQIAGMIKSDLSGFLRDSEDRGFGKPTQPISGPNEGPIEHVHTEMSDREAAEAYKASLDSDD